MMSKVKRTDTVTAKHIEISFDILGCEELQNELKTLKDIFKASYGPTGRLNLIQNVNGGHVTATSHSSRILNSITSVSSPLTRLMLQAVKGHLNRFNDGGLFTGQLILELIEATLKSSLPRHTAIQMNDHALDLLLGYLNSSGCPHKIQADIGNMEQMLCVIKSILGTKFATGISFNEIHSLAILLLRGFLTCVPSAGMGNMTITLENLRLHGCEGPAINESSFVQGVLLDVSFIPADNMIHENSNQAIKVALFASALAGNVGDTWFDEAKTELANGGTSIEQDVLATMLAMVDNLIKNGVKLVACQQVIHPTLQRYLTRKGLYFIERLSIRHIQAVQKLTGATLLSSVHGDIDSGCFGSLENIKLMEIHQRRYLHLIPHYSTSQPISTLILCAPDETALDELQLVCSTVLDALKQLVYHPFLLPGGGCFEAHLACFLIQSAQTASPTQESDCTKAQYIEGLYSVASAFLHIARALDHNKYTHSVDTKMHHHWISNPMNSHCSAKIPRCVCGLVTSNQNTEWCLTEELFSKAVDECVLAEPGMTDNLRTDYKSAILDVMSVRINGIKTAFETANVILRIKHFVKEIV